MDNNEFKRLRKSKGYTQTDLAKKLEVSSRTIQKWESGETPINPMAIKLLLKESNISEEYLKRIERGVEIEKEELSLSYIRRITAHNTNDVE